MRERLPRFSTEMMASDIAKRKAGIGETEKGLFDHGTTGLRDHLSYHVGIGALHSPEIPDSGHQKGGGDGEGGEKRGSGKRWLTAKEAPPEAVDDADHRVEPI